MGQILQKMFLTLFHNSSFEIHDDENIDKKIIESIIISFLDLDSYWWDTYFVVFQNSWFRKKNLDIAWSAFKTSSIYQIQAF